MPDHVFAHLTPPSSHTAISRLYHISAALEHLAKTLPEQQDGLAMLIGNMGSHVHCCAVLLDDDESASKPVNTFYRSSLGAVCGRERGQRGSI